MLNVALRRVSGGLPQSSLRSLERARNAAAAFSAGPESGRIAGKSICLVDDVVTTGATVRECAAVLKGCGAASVHVAALAITL